MRQFFKFFFAALLALFIGGFIFLIVFIGLLGGLTSSVTGSLQQESQTPVKDNSILYIDLTLAYPEIGENNSLAIFSGRPQQSLSLHDLLNCIAVAKTDKKIKGIQLKTGGTPNGLATLDQIRNALKDFKAGGKFVYSYGDFVPQADYYVASVADSVFINPLGSVELKGLASNLVFFKGALDKLDIQPEIFYCGQFKSATEPFRMDKMTDPNRRQLAAMQKDVWQQLLLAVAEHTQVDTTTVNAWVQAGAIQTAADAIKYKLADGLKYKDEIETMLRAKTGTGQKDKLPLIAAVNYSKSIYAPIKDTQIALLLAQGEIVDGKNDDYLSVIASETFIREIRKIRDNDKIKAVVMRVNSPGGSALASDVILRELALLQKEKPLVVSMGDVAASGGYYISCSADSIFALPTTVTGSIGVFGMMFNTQKFYNDKLGVTFDTEKNAPYADFPNMNRPLSSAEKNFVQRSVDDIYMTFKSHVSKARKMNLADVDSIAQGRIWTGSAALNNGLVDGMGGIERALTSAAKLAKIDNYSIAAYPTSEDKIEKILKMLTNQDDTEKMLVKNLLGKEYQWLRTFQSLRDQKNKYWMIMPYSIDLMPL